MSVVSLSRKPNFGFRFRLGIPFTPGEF